MKLALFIIPLMAVFTPASSVTVTVGYDIQYDNPYTPTENVLCGSKLAENYPHFVDIPGFSKVGAASDITESRAACGACRQLTNMDNGNSIYFAVIDGLNNPYNVTISLGAFTKLTNSTVPVNATLGYVNETFCGFPPNF
jgi:hypothetical protein